MIKAKNMFLLVLTIVFALTLSGTVFAEDVGVIQRYTISKQQFS